MIETLNNNERLVTPIQHHDEYCAKTDNLKSLSKAMIRNTLYRSVSFMKKSFNRSNSSLSTGSLHSSSMHSCDSNITNITDDSLNTTLHNDNPAGKKSCLKGTRIRKENSKPLRLRFKRSHDKIYKIEPYFEYSIDLWYTRNDEKDIFSQPGLETVIDTTRAETYMRAYTQARKQVYPKTWFDGKTPVPSKPEKLSTILYDEIVIGKIYGFAGLDQYSFNLKKTRRIHIQHTVLMIAAAYYDCLSNCNEGGSLEDKAKLLRSYSRSLTAVDRYWSTAIGQSDADAAADIYKEDTIIVEEEEDNNNNNNSDNNDDKNNNSANTINSSDDDKENVKKLLHTKQ